MANPFNTTVMTKAYAYSYWCVRYSRIFFCYPKFAEA